MQNGRLTVGQLASFLQHGLFGLLHDDRLESGVVYERTSPCWISVLKSLQILFGENLDFIKKKELQNSSVQRLSGTYTI